MAPYKMPVTLPDGKRLTSVICDQEDFDRAIDTLRGVIQANKEGPAGDDQQRIQAARAGDDDLQRIKAAQHLPLAARGKLTEPLFQMFGVETELMSLAVRGLADRMAQAQVEAN